MGDISQLDVVLGDAFFGGNEVAGGLIIAVALLLSITLPMIIYKVDIALLLILDFLAIALITAIGWLDPYIFVTMLLMICLIVGLKMTKVVTGGA